MILVVAVVIIAFQARQLDQLSVQVETLETEVETLETERLPEEPGLQQRRHPLAQRGRRLGSGQNLGVTPEVGRAIADAISLASGDIEKYSHAPILKARMTTWLSS